MISLIPMWGKALIIALILGALFGAVKIHDHKVFKAGQAAIQDKWNAAEARRVVENDKAILSRIAKNTLDAEAQAKTNQTIKKAHDDEISQVRTAIASAPRVRVGAGICPRLAAATEAASSSSSDATSPATGLLSAQADRAFRELVAEMEETAATARAAQAFITANGLAP